MYLTEKDVTTIFDKLSEYHTFVKTELQYTNPFTLLVAVILSARATDRAVNLITAKLFPLYDTPEKLLAFGEDNFRAAIKSLGLYNNKAKNIIELCRQLLQGKKIENSLENLMQLPGVGRKTANVILSCIFDQPTIAVDTHVARVSKRLGLTNQSNKHAVEKELLALIPAKYLPTAHSLLVLHGRYICKAIKPQCSRCVVKDYCSYFQQQVSKL